MKLDEIEKLCDETSSGPWHLCFHLASKENDSSCPCEYRGGIWGEDQEHMVCEMGSTIHLGEEGLEPERYDRAQELKNAKFISASRTLMPKLIEIVKLAHYTTCNHIGGAVDFYSVPKYEVEMLEKALEELEKE